MLGCARKIPQRTKIFNSHRGKAAAQSKRTFTFEGADNLLSHTGLGIYAQTRFRLKNLVVYWFFYVQPWLLNLVALCDASPMCKHYFCSRLYFRFWKKLCPQLRRSEQQTNTKN